MAENSTLQEFPQIRGILQPHIFKLCEEKLKTDLCFFEGLFLSFALHSFEGKQSLLSAKAEAKKVMCIKNLIQFIQKIEPNGLPSTDAFQFDDKYSGWLHALYVHLGPFFTVYQVTEEAAEAFEDSLKYCPGYLDSKTLDFPCLPCIVLRSSLK